jgi:multiple sugar transport system permease protein
LPKDSAFAGNLWPDHPTLRNFSIMFSEHRTDHFWLQPEFAADRRQRPAC